MKGLHIIADLYQCESHAQLVSAKKLRLLCMKACQNAGLTALFEHFYQFDSFDQVQDGGATGAVILAESHLAIHTWPETANATLDIYVCNVSADNSTKAEKLYAELLTCLKPADTVVHRVLRGKGAPIRVAA